MSTQNVTYLNTETPLQTGTLEGLTIPIQLALVWWSILKCRYLCKINQKTTASYQKQIISILTCFLQMLPSTRKGILMCSSHHFFPSVKIVLLFYIRSVSQIPKTCSVWNVLPVFHLQEALRALITAAEKMILECLCQCYFPL